MGRVRALTDVQGQVIGTRRYTPFGAVEAGSGVLSPFGFTGEPQDSATGLVYLRARYYSPALGRFLTPDSIVPDVLNGQAWNAYAYVYHDPINLVDPSGYAAQGPWQPPVPPPPLPLTPPFPPAVQEAAQRASDLWQDLRGGAEALGTWWNTPDCPCEPQPASSDPSSWLSPDTSFRALVTAGLARFTTPVHRTALVETQRRYGVGPVGLSRWRRDAGPVRLVMDTYARDLRSGRLPTGRWKWWKQARYHVTDPRLASVPGWRGFRASLIYGAMADMLWQGLYADYGRCLAPRDRASNLATAAAFSSVGGLSGAGAYAAVRTRFGSNYAMVSGGIIGFMTANFVPPVSAMKRQLVR